MKDGHLEVVHHYVLLQTLEDIIIGYCLIFLLIKLLYELALNTLLKPCLLVSCCQCHGKHTQGCFLCVFLKKKEHIDDIRESFFWFSLYGNNIISGAITPTCVVIRLHFYLIRETTPINEWLYNGGPHELIVLWAYLLQLLQQSLLFT